MANDNQLVEQAQIVSQSTISEHQNITRLALFDSSGDPLALDGAVAGEAVADIETADAVDLPTAEALANECKAKLNELLASLRAAGSLEA